MGQAMVQNAAASAGGAAAAAGAQKMAVGLDKILSGVAGSAAAAAATPAKPLTPPPPPATTGKRGKPSPYQPTVNRAGGTEMTPAVATGGGGAHNVPAPGEVEAVTSGESVPGNSWVSRGHVQQQQPTLPPQSTPGFTPYVSTEGGPVVNRGSRHALAAPQLAGGITMPSPIAIISTPVVPPPPPQVLATPEKLAGIQEGATMASVLAELGTPASKIAMFDDGKLSESLRIEFKGNRIGTILLVDGVVTSVEKFTN
jgi:hypothetical protein